MSRAAKGTPTAMNLSVLLAYIDGRGGSVEPLTPKPLAVGMTVDLRRVARTSIESLKRCIRAELLIETDVRGMWTLTQKGFETLCQYIVDYPVASYPMHRGLAS